MLMLIVLMIIDLIVGFYFNTSHVNVNQKMASKGDITSDFNTSHVNVNQ